MSLKGLDHSQLKGEKLAQLIFIPVKDAISLLWGENPKEHDLGGIIESIQKYGMQEIPVYDSTLPGIKAGNGRTYALGVMEAQKLPQPAGIGVTESGDWAMPLLVGTDADSIALAKAYAIDSNNLTMAGGNFTAYDMLKMWSESKYLDLLTGLGKENVFTVSVDANTLDDLLKMKDFGDPINTDHVDMDNAMEDQVYTIGVILKNGAALEDAIEELREVLSEHPEWNASLKV